MLTSNEWIAYFLTLPCSVLEYPFGPEVAVIKIKNKMFGLIQITEQPVSLSLKCDPHLALSYRQKYTAITPGYHLNKQHWNSVLDNDTIPYEEIEWLIRHSYEMVIKSFTKKDRLLIEAEIEGCGDNLYKGEPS